MTHNLSFHYHADMTTKGLGSAKVEVFRNITPVNRNKTGLFSHNDHLQSNWVKVCLHN